MRKYIIIAVMTLSVVALCGCGSKEAEKKLTSGEIVKETEKKTEEKTTEEITESDTEPVTEIVTTLQMTNDTMYAVAMVNVRNIPNVEGELVTVLNPGDAVERIGTLENGWSKIRINGNEECYINTVYLTSDMPVQTEPATSDIQTEAPPVQEIVPAETAPAETVPADTPETVPETQLTVPPEEQKAIAQSYIGYDINSLIKAIGAPIDSMHSASCYYEGEQDGIFYYSTFTVYTHTVNGVDYIDYVE